jgi:hypothetical protein
VDKNKKSKFVSFSNLFNSSIKKIVDDNISIMTFFKGVEILLPDKRKIAGYVESTTPSYKDNYIFVCDKENWTSEVKKSRDEMTPKELVHSAFFKKRIRVDELPKNTKFMLLG